MNWAFISLSPGWAASGKGVYHSGNRPSGEEWLKVDCMRTEQPVVSTPSRIHLRSHLPLAHHLILPEGDVCAAGDRRQRCRDKARGKQGPQRGAQTRVRKVAVREKRREEAFGASPRGDDLTFHPRRVDDDKTKCRVKFVRWCF